MCEKIYDKLCNILLKNEKYVAIDGVNEIKVVNKTLIANLARNYDSELLSILQKDEDFRKHFFSMLDNKTQIFKLETFLLFIDSYTHLPDSFTAYKKQIGLATDKNNYLAKNRGVVLNWAYKDCILEGGQSKDDQKRNEIFFNEILSPDQINRLLDAKVFTNWKRHDKDGEHELTTLKDNDNLIIKGNNLVVLHSLKKRYAGMVKLIYIDPPYNTGGDSFKYNDNFNHTTWLTFMKNRLEVAIDLLRDDGVIFVQCDDNEQAYLKVMMDEIFGRENFVGTLIHQRAKGGGNAKFIVKGHDYVMIYAKELNDMQKFIREKVLQKGVVEINGKEYIRDDDVVRKVFGKYDRSLGDRRCFYDELSTYKTDKQISDINEKINNKEFVLEDFGNGKQVIVKYTLVEEAYSKLYSIINAMSENATNHLLSIGIDFSNPKPEELMQFIINSCTKKHDILLDFHLGSGTTAAVAHKMNRQYIGIEQMEYIENVSVERLKKVIEGEQGGISKSANWNGGGDFVYCELFNDAEDFRKEVKKSNNAELNNLFEKAQQSSFLSYRVNREHFAGFDDLTEAEKRKLLLELVDANTLYINYTDLYNKDYNISELDKKFNKIFYRDK